VHEYAPPLTVYPALHSTEHDVPDARNAPVQLPWFPFGRGCVDALQGDAHTFGVHTCRPPALTPVAEHVYGAPLNVYPASHAMEHDVLE
jgi:hypothetical protein